MRMLLAIVYCFMNLAGCTDDQNRRMVVSARENGVTTLDSRTDVRRGVARFECVASATGRCHYTVFAEGKKLSSFSLAVAQTHREDHLPGGFEQCVSRDAAVPLTASCEAPR